MNHSVIYSLSKFQEILHSDWSKRIDIWNHDQHLVSDVKYNRDEIDSLISTIHNDLKTCTTKEYSQIINQRLLCINSYKDFIMLYLINNLIYMKPVDLDILSVGIKHIINLFLKHHNDVNSKYIYGRFWYLVEDLNLFMFEEEIKDESIIETLKSLIEIELNEDEIAGYHNSISSCKKAIWVLSLFDQSIRAKEILQQATKSKVKDIADEAKETLEYFESLRDSNSSNTEK